MPPTEEDSPLLGNRSGSLSSTAAGVLLVHLYHRPNSFQLAPDSAGSLTFTYGDYTAEQLCVAAAKACRILPVYHSLFSLATEDLSSWYPPNHVFHVDESCNKSAVYRIRFFFPNWFGLRKSYRFGPANDQEKPVLDYPTMDYLFAQSRSDFISGQMDVSLTLETQETCLSLAVLDMLRISKERKWNLEETLRTISYKSCLPEKLRSQLQTQNFIIRKRIRHHVSRSIRKISVLQTESRSLKLKYLMELESLRGAPVQETFITKAPAVKEATWLIRVSGETGISTSHSDTETCQPFCDFPEITDISIKQASRDGLPVENRVVSITKTDSRVLEMEFLTLRDALSFVSLVDGYYRLTVDTQHYFCKEVAPPRLLENLENQCHGPITPEFATNKLKTMGHGAGSYLLRRSPEDFDSYLLTTCIETPIGKDFKSILIQKNKDGTFSTAGVCKKFCSLRELTGVCRQFHLQADGITLQLDTHCPPQPKEKSNLLIARGGSCHQLPTSPSAPRRAINQMMFHKIQAENLVQLESLGQGTFTRIYRGIRKEQTEEEEEEEEEEEGEARNHTTDIVMKVLDLSHCNWVEPFLEAASMIGQLSHKHLILLYGVCVGAENIMVQEYVKHGALDTYLRRNHATGKVTSTWKLQIAKQLAYVLNFLEDKKIVHGNISAKKVLLVREGDAVRGIPPFIKLSDPGVSTAMLTKDLLVDRIPWVAPECLEDSKKLALESDKWSFGATIWEICNNGNMPLTAKEPGLKLKFYQDRHLLPPLKWTELANLVGQCMDYNPQQRPAFRAIIRDLNSLITSDYELLSDIPATDSFGGYSDMSMCQDPNLFEDRHLKYISVLGKGNFGSVELCRYDPLGDSTGELVAVKRLQQSSPEQRLDFEQEIAILRALHHDYIVAYRGVCYSRGRNCLRLVMEYLPSGCLRNYLQKNQERLDLKKLLLYAWQVCKGMEYLGSQRYIHRDLAARNILVENENRVKIGDFGLAKILPHGKEYYVVREPGQSPIFWYAPESLADNIFSQESDVWSFGIFLYELFTYGSKISEEFLHMMGHSKPLQIVCQLLEFLKGNGRLPPPASCPTEVYDLMLSCWAFMPNQRPRFSELAPQIETLRNGRSKARG